MINKATNPLSKVNKKLLTSIRSRILAWIMLVVFTALASVLYLTDAVRRGEIHSSANTTVELEIKEFSTFVAESPTPFMNSRELLQAYLTQEIPQDQQILLGRIRGQTVRQKTHDSIPATATAESQEALMDEVFNSPTNSGVFNGVHWGRLAITAPGDPTPDYFVTAVYTDEQLSQLNTQTQLLMGLGSIVMVLAIFMAWLISNQILVPIRSLRDASNQITDSDLTFRVPVEGDDEIADLARTFNRMLDRIDTAYQVQRQFIDDAGHELRTPITVIRGHLELLGTATPDQRERSIELCTDELDRMTRMVNDLLTLAIADAAGLSFLNLEPTDLTELTIDIEDKAHIVSRGRAQVTTIAEGVVLADSQRITEAILELIRNAMKYTEDDSAIIIESANFDGQVSFSVRDFGPGIEVGAQAQLFHRFKRGPSPLTDNTPKKGAGLGLSIVKVIAEAHGGYAWVRSEPGFGAIFGLSFPATNPSPHSDLDFSNEEFA